MKSDKESRRIPRRFAIPEMDSHSQWDIRMPGFTSINRGQAWSSLSGQNTSQRVTTGASNRPEAEIKLSGRKVEIRTGARVTRARGPWVTFKRFLTGIGSNLGAVSKEQQTQRLLRHAEHRFDKHVNQLVEDLANKPNLTVFDVSKRLNRISDEAKTIRANSDSVKRSQLADRFAKNLNESLEILGKRDPEALARVAGAFQDGGELDDLKTKYTFYSDPDYKRLEGIDLYEDGGLTMQEYVEANIVRPPNRTQHSFVQRLIGKMSDVPRQAREIHVQTQKEQAKLAVDTGSPFTGRIVMDLRSDSSVRETLEQEVNQQPLKSAGKHELAQEFLKDVGRSTMKLTGRNGETTDIRQSIKEKGLADKYQERNSFAGGLLEKFTGEMGFNGDEQARATRNVSRLMHQKTVGSSLNLLATKVLLNEYGGLAPLVESETEKCTYDFSVDKNGDLVCRNSKESNSGTIYLGGKARKLDSGTNTAEEILTIRVRREDLSKEPLKFEILGADVTYNLDTRGATNV